MTPKGPLGAPRPLGVGPLTKAQATGDLAQRVAVLVTTDDEEGGSVFDLDLDMVGDVTEEVFPDALTLGFVSSGPFGGNMLTIDTATPRVFSDEIETWADEVMARSAVNVELERPSWQVTPVRVEGDEATGDDTAQEAVLFEYQPDPGIDPAWEDVMVDYLLDPENIEPHLPGPLEFMYVEPEEVEGVRWDFEEREVAILLSETEPWHMTLRQFNLRHAVDAAFEAFDADPFENGIEVTREGFVTVE